MTNYIIVVFISDIADLIQSNKTRYLGFCSYSRNWYLDEMEDVNYSMSPCHNDWN